MPDQIQQERIATCLDTTLLVVSCLEQAGLNPLIFLQDSHAWVGCWLVDQSLPISTVDDQAVLRKRIDAGELLAIESIGVTPQSHLSFAQAVQAGAQRLAEQQQHRFELAIDVQRARQGLKILPLSLRSSALPTETVIDQQETTIEEIALPTLSTDIVVNSTNDTTRDRNRVDIWRSKLLDLTLRNKLINFKESSKQAVPLFTPQPEDVENLLAQGKALKLKSLLDLMPEQDPRALEHQARSTQATLQAHLSRQALSKQELLADLDGDQLDKRLTEIFRNARTAQEEGGANTLFLVFGMLQWTDSKDRSRSMRAPMVMVPVTLERQSVNSAFVLRRHDDDTIVNPTLLQLLEHQFELKIPRVTHASELPQDESGVDIAAIWASFRSAVVDLSGFEVIPSVWLGLFSFTKYLMWQDLESILDECLGSGMRVHTLKWHYRSQKESLITFSNHRYYDAQLITFPSPTHPDNGVTFHHVDGVYQRAGARNNRQEAEAVVTFIEQHLQADHPNPPSIGVVTFSQAQQQLIEDLLDAARRKNPVLDRQIQALTNEPLFVKNLENVQGDERGIILFSICYGPDETGRVAMNFGPLNRDGGHRRLNVAITRAKTQIHLFSTLHPDQLDLSRTKARGVADLKHYLQFAIQGAPALVAQTSPTGLSPDSPFEVEVLNHLLDQGWQVHCQVGCSSYRIDLAVVDPRAEGRYLLAIECDGASYHSAATARDRDKLRQMVLE